MNNGRVFWGVLLVVVGIVFLLDRTGVVEVGTLISDWWPLLLIIAGALSLFRSPRDLVGPLIMMGAGAILLLSTLGLVNISVWQLLWPLALIGIGIWVLVGRVSPERGEADGGRTNRCHGRLRQPPACIELAVAGGREPRSGVRRGGGRSLRGHPRARRRRNRRYRRLRGNRAVGPSRLASRDQRDCRYSAAGPIAPPANRCRQGRPPFRSVRSPRLVVSK